MQDKEEVLIWCASSLIAGAANYLSKISESPRKFRWLTLTSHLVSAPLAGFIVGNLCSQYGMSEKYIYAVVALAGWMGPRILDKAGEALTNMLPELISRGQVAMYVMVKPKVEDEKSKACNKDAPSSKKEE